MIYGKPYEPPFRQAGVCAQCGDPIEVGEDVWVSPNGNDIYHEECMECDWKDIIQLFEWRYTEAESNE